MDRKTGETKDEILAAVDGVGLSLTAPQLARLHRAGAIPEPAIQSLGRGKGRASIYPPGTARDVMRLVELAPSERRLPERAWLRWWLDGGAMSAAARNYLSQRAGELERTLQAVRALERGETIEMDGRRVVLDDLYRAAEEERLSGVVARARGRIGKKRFSSVAAFLMQLGSGQFRAFPVDSYLGTSEPEKQLVELALGLERARRESLAGHQPWLQGDLEHAFSRLATQLNELSFTRQARESDVLLDDARTEMRGLVEVVSGAADFLDAVFGRGAFSYREIAEAVTPRRYQDQVFALLAWSQMRRDLDLRNGMSEIIALRGTVQQMESGLILVERLRESVPALAPLLAPKRLAAALRDPSEMARFQAELAEAREGHDREIEAALAGFDKTQEAG